MDSNEDQQLSNLQFKIPTKNPTHRRNKTAMFQQLNALKVLKQQEDKIWAKKNQPQQSPESRLSTKENIKIQINNGNLNLKHTAFDSHKQVLKQGYESKELAVRQNAMSPKTPLFNLPLRSSSVGKNKSIQISTQTSGQHLEQSQQPEDLEQLPRIDQSLNMSYDAHHVHMKHFFHNQATNNIQSSYDNLQSVAEEFGFLPLSYESNREAHLAKNGQLNLSGGSMQSKSVNSKHLKDFLLNQDYFFNSEAFKNGYLSQNFFQNRGSSREFDMSKRMKQQRLVYGQNSMLKQINARRTEQRRKMTQSMNQFPEKNFIKKNKDGIQDLKSQQVMKKLERIQKLQQTALYLSYDNFNFKQNQPEQKAGDNESTIPTYRKTKTNRWDSKQKLLSASSMGSKNSIRVDNQNINLDPEGYSQNMTVIENGGMVSEQTFEHFKRNLKDKKPGEILQSLEQSQNLEQINKHLSNLDKRKPRSRTAEQQRQRRLNRKSVGQISNEAFEPHQLNNSRLSSQIAILPPRALSKSRQAVHIGLSDLQIKDRQQRPQTGGGQIQKKRIAPSSITTKKFEFNNKQMSIQNEENEQALNLTEDDNQEQREYEGQIIKLPSLARPRNKYQSQLASQVNLNNASAIVGTFPNYPDIISNRSQRIRQVREQVLSFKNMQNIDKSRQSNAIQEANTEQSLLKRYEQEYERVLKFKENDCNQSDLEVIHQMQMLNFQDSIQLKSIAGCGFSEDQQTDKDQVQVTLIQQPATGQSHLLGKRRIQQLMLFTDAESGVNSVFGPIFDVMGQIIYKSQHRKPKWVAKNELERFNQFHDECYSYENSSNGRIRMENPFNRKPNQKYVFPMISPSEIAKFIKSQLYLQNKQFDAPQEIQLVPTMETHELFMSEVLRDIKQPMVDLCRKLHLYEKQELIRRFGNYPFENLQIDLKDHLFISELANCPVYIWFKKSYKRFDRKRRRNFIWKEAIMAEQTSQHKAIYDPCHTAQQCLVYGKPIPMWFYKSYRDLHVWNVKFSQYASFTEMESFATKDLTAFIAKNFKPDELDYCRLVKARKQRERSAKDEEELRQIIFELENDPSLKIIQPLAYPKLKQPTQADYDQNYAQYYQITIHTTRDSLQIQIMKQLAKLKPTIVFYDLYNCSSFPRVFDQSDYLIRKKLNSDIEDALAFETQPVNNLEVCFDKLHVMLNNLQDPRNFVILTKLVKPITSRICHPNLYFRLRSRYFTFKRQNEFYYEWFSQFNEKQASKKVFRMKQSAITMGEDIAIDEDMQFHFIRSKKKSFMDKRHIDVEAFIDSIYKPSLTAVTPMILKNNTVSYRHSINWLMSRFEPRTEHSLSELVSERCLFTKPKPPVPQNRFLFVSPTWNVQSEYERIAEDQMIGHNCYDVLLRHSVFVSKYVMTADPRVLWTTGSSESANETQHAYIDSPDINDCNNKIVLNSSHSQVTANQSNKLFGPRITFALEGAMFNGNEEQASSKDLSASRNGHSNQNLLKSDGQSPYFNTQAVKLISLSEQQLVSGQQIVGLDIETTRSLEMKGKQYQPKDQADPSDPIINRPFEVLELFFNHGNEGPLMETSQMIAAFKESATQQRIKNYNEAKIIYHQIQNEYHDQQARFQEFYMQLEGEEEIQPVQLQPKPASDDGLYFPEFYCFKVDMAQDQIYRDDKVAKSVDILREPFSYQFEMPNELNQIEFSDEKSLVLEQSSEEQEQIQLPSQPKATEQKEDEQQGTGNQVTHELIPVAPPKDYTIYREPMYVVAPDPPIYIDCSELEDYIMRFESRYRFGLSSGRASESEEGKFQRVSTIGDAQDELDFQTCEIEVDPLKVRRAVIHHWLECVNGDSVFKGLNLRVEEDRSIRCGKNVREYRQHQIEVLFKKRQARRFEKVVQIKRQIDKFRPPKKEQNNPNQFSHFESIPSHRRRQILSFESGEYSNFVDEQYDPQFPVFAPLNFKGEQLQMQMQMQTPKHTVLRYSDLLAKINSSEMILKKIATPHKQMLSKNTNQNSMARYIEYIQKQQLKLKQEQEEQMKRQMIEEVNQSISNQILRKFSKKHILVSPELSNKNLILSKNNSVNKMKITIPQTPLPMDQGSGRSNSVLVISPVKPKKKESTVSRLALIRSKTIGLIRDRNQRKKE